MTKSSVADAIQLQPEQLQTFDHDYVSPTAYEHIMRELNSRFSARSFTFLDVGGGQGHFTDRLLEHFSHARGVVLDNAELLLAANEPDPRKETVLGSALHLDRLFAGSKFDAIFFNLSLHHFIGASYAESRALQRQALHLARQRLTAAGFVSVVEDIYDGALIDNLPSRLVFELTSNRSIAPLIRKLGANTAGCGVCFLSSRTWCREFRAAGYSVERHGLERAHRPLVQRMKLTALTVRSFHQEHFTLRPHA